MQLIVLAVPGCPNVAVLDGRPAAVLDDRAGVSVAHEVICDESEAVRWGMRGSPTLLIDRADPFAERGQPPSMSCRKYRDGHGQMSRAPSAAQLRQAIERAPATTARPAQLEHHRHQPQPGHRVPHGLALGSQIPACRSTPGTRAQVRAQRRDGPDAPTVPPL